MNVGLPGIGNLGTTITTLSPNSSRKSQAAGEAFESMLLADLFGKLRQSFTLDPEESDAAGGTLSGIANQALAEAVAAQGGLGVGRLLSQSLDAKKP